MNRTLLLAVFGKCGKAILEDLESGGTDDRAHSDIAITTNSTMTSNSTTTAEPITSAFQARAKSRPYDNAYCYILFVMFFYGFLALTLFRSFAWYNKGKREQHGESQDSNFEEEGSA